MKRQTKGFTLVELSIVLVIIGLLIGGILIGQSMIETAKVNRFISEVQQYEIAAKNYKSRFRYFPGDHPTAYDIFGSDCGIDNDPATASWNGCNGNGDHKLSSGNYTETSSFWYHLSQSGLLGKTRFGIMYAASASSQAAGSTIPLFSLDENLVGTAFSNSSWLYGNAPSSYGTNGIWFGVCYIGGCDPYYLSVSLTRAIDAKADDGKPGTGNFYGFRSSADVTAGHCVTSLSYITSEYKGDDTGDGAGCAFTFRNLNEDVAL